MQKLFIVIALGTAVFGAELVNPLQIIGVSLKYPDLDTLAFNRVAEKLSAERIPGKLNLIYKINEGFPAPKFAFVPDSINVDSGKGPLVLNSGKYEYWRFRNPGKIYTYRVQSVFQVGASGQTPLEDYLTSAYMVESGEMSFNEMRYTKLNLKSNSEFWKRNFISQGFGAQYIYKDNNFASGGWLAIGFGYLWDVLNFAAIFGGPFFGKHTTDKIGIPIIGVANSLFWKVAFNGWIVKWDMNIYNRLAKSGYPTPKNYGWSFNDRFGDVPQDSIPIVEIK